jgi:hypothetical protein
VRYCNVPTCDQPLHARGLCQTHYARQRDCTEHARRLAPYMVEPRDVERWLCECPDARHDDWECPTCRRPSYRPETVERLMRKRAA